MKAEWRALFADVKARFFAVGDPSRLMYFIFVVVGIGGLGAWQAAGDAELFRTNLATYAMGISAAAAVELVLPGATSRALRMLAISVGIVACAAALMYRRTGVEDIVWVAATFGWILWILSNSANANIGGSDPLAATGGSTDSVAGDLSGFETESGS